MELGESPRFHRYVALGLIEYSEQPDFMVLVRSEYLTASGSCRRFSHKDDCVQVRYQRIESARSAGAVRGVCHSINQQAVTGMTSTGWSV